MVKQNDSKSGGVNVSITGDNDTVFGGNFTFNQYPSGQPPALILRLYYLLGPSRINTRLWHNSRHYDDYWDAPPNIKAHLSQLAQPKYPASNNWESLAHYYDPSDAMVHRAAAVDIAKQLSEDESLLGTILLPQSPHQLSNPYHVITTLAFQIALNIPGVAKNIVEAIESVPWIHELDAVTQVTTLITIPLIKATAGQDPSNNWKWIVVDEPERHSSYKKLPTAHIISELSKTPTREKLGFNLGFVITASSNAVTYTDGI